MDFVKRLAGLFAPRARVIGRHVYPVRVQCARCGEIIAAPVDLRNDLSADFNEQTGSQTFICRKVLMGRARCFQQIEVVLRFDTARRLIDHKTAGGTFLPVEDG